jgi:hypothetical protein
MHHKFSVIDEIFVCSKFYTLLSEMYNLALNMHHAPENYSQVCKVLIILFSEKEARIYSKDDEILKRRMPTNKTFHNSIFLIIQ